MQGRLDKDEFPTDSKTGCSNSIQFKASSPLSSRKQQQAKQNLKQQLKMRRLEENSERFFFKEVKPVQV